MGSRSPSYSDPRRPLLAAFAALAAYFFCAAAAALALPAAAYFFMKRSTRPSVSTIFCVPVKKGWQLEQISTLIWGRVDPVSNVLPHTQATEAFWYLG